MSDNVELDPSQPESDSSAPSSIWRDQLPLESPTTWFILVNALDVFMTYILLNLDGFRESNEVANFVLQKFGMRGMIYFKFVMVAVVTVIAQIVARKKLWLARWLLIGGTIFVSCVVIYSSYLFIKYSGFFFVETAWLQSTAQGR